MRAPNSEICPYSLVGVKVFVGLLPDTLVIYYFGLVIGAHRDAQYCMLCISALLKRYNYIIPIGDA